MADQLSLFDSPPEPARAAPAVRPAAAVPEHAALAKRLSPLVHLGTSSWSFPGWQGLVYGESASESRLARDGLAAYARHPLLRTVGVDRGLYAPIEREQYRRYAAQVPADFRFLVKAPALVADAFVRAARGEPLEPNPRFLDAAAALDLFVAPALEGLGETTGPLVFQLAPFAATLPRDAVPATIERLGRFLAEVARGAGAGCPLLAVELRDRELLQPALAAALAASGARLCYGVHPRMPSIDAQAAAMAGPATGPLVVRWNLHAGYAYEAAKARYAPFDRMVEPDLATRTTIARLVARTVAAGAPAFVIANNKAEGSAPASVFALAAAIDRARAAPDP